MSLLKRRRLSLLPSLAAAILLYSAASPASAGDNLPLAKVDLSRITGRWYIIATIPNFLERGVVAGYDVFTPQPDGKILEDFYLRKGSFQDVPMHSSTSITVLPDSHNADWGVQVLGPIRLPFNVLCVDPKSRFVLFGEQNREWGRINSRKQLVTDQEYPSMLSHFKSMGYNTGRFLKCVQVPAQIGQSGYWNDGVQ